MLVEEAHPGFQIFSLVLDQQSESRENCEDNLCVIVHKMLQYSQMSLQILAEKSVAAQMTI
jgi:hypothetical protein